MDTEERTALRRVGVHGADLAAELQLYAAEALKAGQALSALAYFMAPEQRRQRVEAELGYKVPDWVWRVWEQQARQFGSGNGQEGHEHGH